MENKMVYFCTRLDGRLIVSSCTGCDNIPDGAVEIKYSDFLIYIDTGELPDQILARLE